MRHPSSLYPEKRVRVQSGAMYRTLLPILLCINAATTAPQNNGNSDITYVKIQPVTDDRPSVPVPNHRESKIEKLPLTVPGSSESNLKNESKASNNKYVSKSTAKPAFNKSASKQQSILSEKTDSNQEHDTIDSKLDTVPSDSQVRSDVDYTTSSYESIETEFSEDVTERFEDLTEKTETDGRQTKAPTKFVPKLSYSKKFGSFSTNLIETSSKRRFRSRCRCEKIWNCPKLQITVPRCPEEYFLCCF